MVNCKYCDAIMYEEFETLRNKSVRFFYVCPKCHSIYEGEKIESKKLNKVIKSRWFNSQTQQFECVVNYDKP